MVRSLRNYCIWLQKCGRIALLHIRKNIVMPSHTHTHKFDFITNGSSVENKIPYPCVVSITLEKSSISYWHWRVYVFQHKILPFICNFELNILQKSRSVFYSSSKKNIQNRVTIGNRGRFFFSWNPFSTIY